MLTGASIFNDGHKNQELDATILARFIRVSHLNNDVIHAASFSKGAAGRRLRGPSPYVPKSGGVFIAISCFTWRDVAAGQIFTGVLRPCFF
jgi:hypothetical protein